MWIIVLVIVYRFSYYTRYYISTNLDKKSLLLKEGPRVGQSWLVVDVAPRDRMCTVTHRELLSLGSSQLGGALLSRWYLYLSVRIALSRVKHKCPCSGH